jgi:hypothetical protein
MSNTPTTSKRSFTSPLTSPAKKRNKNEPVTAIGESNFKQLIKKSTVFIDKTLLIKKFVENAAAVLLITCPRRWGKSINMDMVKTFLEIEMDANGNRINKKTETENYKLFHGIASPNEKLEKCLNIAQYEDFVELHLGEYPIISVDFKDVKGNNYQEIVNRLKMAINDTFKRHKLVYTNLLRQRIEDYNEIMCTTIKTDNKELSYLESVLELKGIKLSDTLNQFKKLFNNNGQEATEIDSINSFKFLSELLYIHFNKRVFILMDEYDTPINSILQNEQFPKEDIDKTLMLFRSIMGRTFKGNEYLEKGLITGVFRIAKASFFSDLNNIHEYNCWNNEFAAYYGFTEDDVKYLFEEHKIDPVDQEKAFKWYDGYRASIDPDLKIFNPWSIVTFLKNKKIGNYWEETGNIDFIKNLFKIKAIKSKIDLLINKTITIDGDLDNESSVEIYLDLKFSKEDFTALKELIDPKKDNYIINPSIVNLFFSYLFAAGYLTVIGKQINTCSTQIKLPNEEVKLA